ARFCSHPRAADPGVLGHVCDVRLVGAGGLMATAQLAPIANDYNIANVPVSILGLTLPALSFALTLDRMVNGASRPFFGWLSDHIGREHTMFLAFLLEGAGIYALFVFASNPIAFVMLSGLVFFAWGEIYSLFPAMCTDIYGRKFATTNYGMLYTAKGTALFILAALLDIGAALMALLLLKPLRIKEIARGQEYLAALSPRRPSGHLRPSSTGYRARLRVSTDHLA